MPNVSDSERQAEIARIGADLSRAIKHDLLQTKSRRLRLAAVVAFVIAIASAAAYGATTLLPSDVAPVLNRPLAQGDPIPAGVLERGLAERPLALGTSRRVIDAPGVTVWQVASDDGQLCEVIRIAVLPTETRRACSAPSDVSNLALRDVDISPTEQPDAGGWFGVVVGIARPDVAAVRVVASDGSAVEVTPNAVGGFVVDNSLVPASAAPIRIEALNTRGEAIQTVEAG